MILKPCVVAMVVAFVKVQVGGVLSEERTRWFANNNAARTCILRLVSLSVKGPRGGRVEIENVSVAILMGPD